MLVNSYNPDMSKGKSRAGGRPAHTDEEQLFKRQVGQNLKTIRKGFQADLTGFAKYLGVAKGTYEKYELGIAFPKPQVWKRLVELGVSTQFVFTGIGKPFTRPIDLSAFSELPSHRKIS